MSAVSETCVTHLPRLSVLPAGQHLRRIGGRLDRGGDGWRLPWRTDEHAARCPAFVARMPAATLSRPYRLTKVEGDAAHAQPWDDAAIGRFLDRQASYRRREFGEHDAEDLAERAHLLDVNADDRRLCLSCPPRDGLAVHEPSRSRRRAGSARRSGDRPAALRGLRWSEPMNDDPKDGGS